MARKRKPKSNMELGIVATYAIQKLGQPNYEELCELITEKIGLRTDVGTQMRDVLDSLKKRGFVAINQKADEHGQQVKYYSLKLITYANPPEVAHINDLLPKLLDDEAAQEVKDYFDAVDGSGDKKKKGPVYDDHHTYTAVFRTLDRFFGARMISPSLKQMLDKSPYQAKLIIDVDEDGNVKYKKLNGNADSAIGLYFDRDVTGGLLIHGAVVRGWFSNNIPIFSKFAKWAGHNACSFDPIVIHPRQDIALTTLPVQRENGQGGAPQTYETLMPGEVFWLRFVAPTKGFMTPMEMKAFMAMVARHSQRYLSPARGAECGRLEMVAFVDHGHNWNEIIKNGKTDVEFDAEVRAALDPVVEKVDAVPNPRPVDKPSVIEQVDAG